MLNEHLQDVMKRNANATKVPDWRKTTIARGPSVLDLDDLLGEYDAYEESDHRDRRVGRNRSYGTMRGILSGGRGYVVDSAPFSEQPASIIVDIVEKRLRGRTLDKYHTSLLCGLRLHCAGKTIGQCRFQTLKGLLTHLAE